MMIDHNETITTECPLVTFDNNVLISLKNEKDDVLSIRQLFAMGRAKKIIINITLSSALENPQSGKKKDIQQDMAWLIGRGILPENIYTGPRSVGFQTQDASSTITFDPSSEITLNWHIHTILFPEWPWSWIDYCKRECRRNDLSNAEKSAITELDALRWGMYIPPTPQSPSKRPTPTLDTLSMEEQQKLQDLLKRWNKNWMNKKNDSLGFYNHMSQSWHTPHPENAVFVTTDKNFRKKTEALRKFGFRGQILPPREAIAFLER